MQPPLARAILEQRASSIVQLGPDGETEVGVFYTGSLADRYSVLRKNSYWAAGCIESWAEPQDLVFSIDLHVHSSHTLQYTWDEPVTVGEVFFMLTAESATGFPVRVSMRDTHEECVLARPLLETGYHGCQKAVTGRKLQIKIENKGNDHGYVQIAGLNIYPSRNLVTELNSPIVVKSEAPR